MDKNSEAKKHNQNMTTDEAKKMYCERDDLARRHNHLLLKNTWYESNY